MCAELGSEVLFLGARRESDDFVTHFVRVLHCEMTQTAETLDSDNVAWCDMLLADGVEDCYAGAKDRGVGGRVDIFGNRDDGFGAEENVLCL